jgi:hypothetical protein
MNVWHLSSAWPVIADTAARTAHKPQLASLCSCWGKSAETTLILGFIRLAMSVAKLMASSPVNAFKLSYTVAVSS